MKKYIQYAVSTLITLLTAYPVYSGTISHTDYVAGQSITAAAQNTNENTIVNLVNGNLDSANLAANAVTTSEITDEAVTVGKLSAGVQVSLLGTVPTGTILPFASTTVPSGYLLCDGSAVDKTTYATLYGVIGIAWGYGNQVTTFNVPDLRGTFMRGLDSGKGNDPNAVTRSTSAVGGFSGDEVGSAQADATAVNGVTVAITDPSHIHTITLSSSGGTSSTTIVANRGSAGTFNQETANSNAGTTATPSGDSETRPLNVNVVYIIKT